MERLGEGKGIPLPKSFTFVAILNNQYSGKKT